MHQGEYDDGLIACADDALVIRRYGMFQGAKRIPYAEIRVVRQIGIGRLRRWRLWGTTDPRLWFNLDWNRPRKSAALVIDAGRRVKPVVTPDDPQQVVAILRSHDVRVSAS
jgi:hypothetical protein